MAVVILLLLWWWWWRWCGGVHPGVGVGGGWGLRRWVAAMNRLHRLQQLRSLLTRLPPHPTATGGARWMSCGVWRGER